MLDIKIFVETDADVRILRRALRDVRDAVGIRLIEPAWRSGDADMKCLIASGMAAAMDEVYGRLNRVCGETLAQLTIADMDKKIFGGERK